MKKVIILLGLFLSVSASATVITAFNIQWFGRGGEIEGKNSDEFRAKRLQHFLGTYFESTDVFTFSEIVDVSMLRNLMSDFNCYSYDEKNLDHQHIAICTRKEYHVTTEVIGSVRLGSTGLRPALIARITDTEGNRFNVVGLHLKARREKTAKRLKQIRALLNNAQFGAPTIIAGDFNSFPKEATSLDYDDAELFESEFSQFGFTEIINSFKTYSFVGSRYKQTLDRAWAKNIKEAELKVTGPCNENENVKEPYSNLRFYNRFISDHCPLSLSFKL